MKILVTGATGFIGNYVIKKLLDKKYNVIATSLTEEKARRFSWFAQVKYLPFNLNTLNSSENYFDYFGRPDKLIHLAWEGLPNYKSLFHFEQNLPNHYALLKNLILNGLNDVTVTGTCLEYGIQEGCLREDLPALPANPYALAKDTLRKFLQELQKMNHFQLKWVRLFYMYGEGQNPNSLLSQLNKAIDSGNNTFNMSGGEQVRDYLPVEDVAEYVTQIALQNRMGNIINCCSGEPVSVKNFVENYLKETKKNIFLNFGYYPYTDYEPMTFWGDSCKLKETVNQL